jgi:hypothetical protein
LHITEHDKFVFFEFFCLLLNVRENLPNCIDNEGKISAGADYHDNNVDFFRPVDGGDVSVPNRDHGDHSKID